MPSGVHCLLLVSLILGEVFFAGSASLHDWFLHFLESAFSVTCFGVFFFGRWHERVWSVDVMSGVGR